MYFWILEIIQKTPFREHKQSGYSIKTNQYIFQKCTPIQLSEIKRLENILGRSKYKPFKKIYVNRLRDQYKLTEMHVYILPEIRGLEIFDTRVNTHPKLHL